MKRAVIIIGVLAAVQGVLVVGYLLLDRGKPASVEVERVRRQAPELVYRSADGMEHRLSTLEGQPVLLHFWATWCPPCREELPGLLEFAAAGEIPVLAVSLDPEWSEVRQFLGRAPPPAVVLALSEDASQDFGVASLPETYLIDAAGFVRLRFAGERDWTSSAVRAVVISETAND